MASVGKIIRARRESLGLAQHALAELSGVAVSTIRNIEGDRVEEARTWRQIERVLGWAPGSLEAIREGEEPRSILPDDVLCVINKARRSLMEQMTRAEMVAEDASRTIVTLEEMLEKAHAVDATRQSEKSEAEIAWLESRLLAARDARPVALEEARESATAYLDFSIIWEATADDLARGVDLASSGLADRTCAFIRHLAGVVSVFDLDLVLHALRNVISLEGWVRIAKADTTGVVRSRTERESFHPSPEKSPQPATGKQILLPIMVDKDELDEIDPEDFAAVVNSLTLEARRMLQFILDVQRRERERGKRVYLHARSTRNSRNSDGEMR
ncbi:multiprotein-bridging factor 1 family protein [Nonomuraea sp. NPDC003560]|uniref:helix-turn-helix domain-containing protein n=1 Tax=Nonomuraea sp. NPDC003560 TaxID=3364341 RepID=UPI00367F1770